jgi:uncharacterized protein YjiS (DUF1127 family)
MDRILSKTSSWSAEMPWSPLRIMHRWYRERQMMAVLMSLDDAQLKDVGLDRGKLPEAARGRSRSR